MKSRIIRTVKALAGGDGPWPLADLAHAAMEFRVRKSIPINDYSRCHREIAADLSREISAVLAMRDHVDTAYHVRRFERDFARICGRRYAVGLNSGTAALELSLKAIGIGPGDEVITVPNTYVATGLAIANTGAKPVFVDVAPATGNLDPARLQSALTSRTKAILPVHLYGQTADMPAIDAFARKHGLKVIADACEAFGAALDGRPAGAFGDAACFSFSSPKILGGLGNGGMIVTDDRALAARARELRDPESCSEHLLDSRRTPAFLDVIQVAILRAKLPHAERWVEARRAVAFRLMAGLEGLGLALPREAPGAKHTYYNFPILCDNRDRMRAHLHKRGVRTGIHYTPLLHLTPCFLPLGHARGDFPVSERIEATTFSLPISPFLSDAEIGIIIGAVKGFFR